MIDPQLLHALEDARSVIRRAERIANACDNAYVAQLCRMAEHKVASAIETIKHVAESKVAS